MCACGGRLSGFYLIPSICMVHKCTHFTKYMTRGLSPCPKRLYLKFSVRNNGGRRRLCTGLFYACFKIALVEDGEELVAQKGSWSRCFERKVFRNTPCARGKDGII